MVDVGDNVEGGIGAEGQGGDAGGGLFLLLLKLGRGDRRGVGTRRETRYLEPTRSPGRRIIIRSVYAYVDMYNNRAGSLVLAPSIIFLRSIWEANGHTPC